MTTRAGAALLGVRSGSAHSPVAVVPTAPDPGDSTTELSPAESTSTDPTSLETDYLPVPAGVVLTEPGTDS